MTHEHQWHDDLRWNHAFETCGCGATRILVEDDETSNIAIENDQLESALLAMQHRAETAEDEVRRLREASRDDLRQKKRAEDELEHLLSELDLLSDNWHRRYMDMPDGHTQKKYGKVIDEFITELNAVIVDAEERKEKR